MKIEKNKDSRLEIRLTKEDKLLLDYLSLSNGYTTSKYLRLTIETLILPLKKQIQLGVKTYDDIETLCNNILQQRRFLDK